MASPSVTAAAIALIYTAVPVVSPSVSRDSVAHPTYKSPRPISQNTAAADFVAQAQLNEICALSRGWDGYDALPIHPDTAVSARVALSAFTNIGVMPELTPNPNGTISFEWTGDFGDSHIEVGKSRYVGIVYLRDEGKYPFVGANSSGEIFRREMQDFAAFVAAALFPNQRPFDMSKHPAAPDVRYAA
jgi:hypothetical protein